jgi:hypothetical protein
MNKLFSNYLTTRLHEQAQLDGGGAELRPAATWTVEGFGIQPPGRFNKCKLDRPT